MLKIRALPTCDMYPATDEKEQGDSAVVHKLISPVFEKVSRPKLFNFQLQEQLMELLLLE